MSKLKVHLESFLVTFVSIFLLTICMAISEPTFTFSKDSMTALILSAIIAGVRAVGKFGYELLKNK